MTIPSQPQNGPFAHCSIVADSSEFDDQTNMLFDRSFGPGRYAKTAERLREGNHCLRSCSHLALSEGNVIAAVKLWPLQIGEFEDAVFVGPVAVDAACRGSALGLDVTQTCLDVAAKAGWTLAVLIGDAPYFGRLGFQPISVSDFDLPGYVEPHRLLAKELKPGVLDGLSGSVSVPRVAMRASSEE